MKISKSLIAASFLLGSASAFAQNPLAKDGPGNNAVNSEKKNSDAPVTGRNSFTEGQAKSAIEKAGFSDVSDLKKDDNGIWRGKASKGGAASAITLDFQGNVSATQ